MSVVDPTKTTALKGSGDLFFIPGPKVGDHITLGHTRITERVSPRSVVGQPEYYYASIFFIESRNVHKLESQMKGVLCAVKLEVEKQCFEWCLGICCAYVKDRDCVKMFIWKGNMVKAPGEHKGSVPDFYLHVPCKAPKNRQEYETQKSTWESMFSYEMIRGSEPSLILLNQCWGCVPNLNLANVKTMESINLTDQCFECSTIGPDHHKLPWIANKLSADYPIRATFPWAYYTESQTHPRITANPIQATPTQYQRPTKPSKLGPPFTGKYPALKSGYAAWTQEPHLYTFQEKSMEYALVYVEDTIERTRISSDEHLKMVAIPFLETNET